MGGVFTKEFIVQTVIQVLLVGGVVFFVQKSYESYLAEERLRNESLLASKKEAYYYAIEVAYRHMAAVDYDRNAVTGKTLPIMKRNRGTAPPNELEINMAFSKLYLYAGDTSIVSSFYRTIVRMDSNYTPIYHMKEFLDRISRDLNESQIERKNIDFPYIIADTSHKLLEVN
jgi:hypothetical protein